MSRRRYFWLVLLLFAMARLAGGQTTLQGGASTTAGPTLANIYGNQDPNAGNPEVIPADNDGTCLRLGGMEKWVFVQQVGKTCYWLEPYPTPLKGKIMTPKQAAQNDWPVCKAHPWDPTLVICYGTPGPKKVTPGPTVYQGYTTSDPCILPQFNSQTAAGWAQHQADYERTAAACLAFRCSHNPGLNGCPGAGHWPTANRTPPQKPDPNPLGNVVDYVAGLMDGAGDCIKSFADLLVGANAFAHGDFVFAAQAWGLTPGQSVVLKGIYTELTQQVVGSNVSARDLGRIAGRRICQYGLVSGTATVGNQLLRARTPGLSVLNPIKAKAFLETSTKSPETLAGRYVETTRGPTKLGAYVGGGSFGNVYEMPQGKVAKISTNKEGSAASFPRQIEGSERLQQIGVPTPTIELLQLPGPEQPGMLLMDNVKSRWPGAEQISYSDFLAKTKAEKIPYIAAVNKLTGNISGAGYIWADNHFGNMMFQKTPQGMIAIVHDSDIVLTPPEMEVALEDLEHNIPARVLFGALQGVGKAGLAFGSLDATTIMKALQSARLGGAEIGGSSTVIPPGR